MIRKLSVFILLSVSAVTVFAQQSPESKRRVETEINSMVLGMPVARGSYLGIQTVEVTKENFAKYGLSNVRGVAIEKVVKDSPAAQAGFQKGDVIVKFNGEEITSVFKLTRLINEVAPDHQARVTVLRGGSESDLTVTLGKRELPQFQSGVFSTGNVPLTAMPQFPRVPMPPNGRLLPAPGEENNFFIFRGGANRQIGISSAPLTRQLAEYFGVTGGQGVLIDSVRENSPAARTGLKAGDVITQADGKEIKNSLDLVRAINDKNAGEVVNLTIIRDKTRQTVSVTPEVSKNATMPFGEFKNFGDGQPMRFRMQMPNAPAAPLPPNQIKPAP